MALKQCSSGSGGGLLFNLKDKNSDSNYIDPTIHNVFCPL